jgi:hypothetical protein
MLVFQGNEDLENKKSTWRAMRWKWEGGHAVALHGHVVGRIFHPVGPFQAFFASTESSWPKKYYIYDLPAQFRDGTMEKHGIHNTDLNKDRRGEPTGAAPSRPFASIDIISFITMIKMESFIPTPWYFVSNLYQSLYCASLIRVTWGTYLDCDHICMTPMVDLLLLRWFMRCKLIVVLDVLMDVIYNSVHVWFVLIKLVC